MKTTVIIDFDIAGLHNYPDAPDEVQFLRHRHRHLFRIRAGFFVNGLDREKEIFIMQSKVFEYLKRDFGFPCEFKQMSCEMIAQTLLIHFKHNNMIWCEVFEDNRGGARVEL